MRHGPLTREFGLIPDPSIPVSEEDLDLYCAVRDNIAHPDLPLEDEDRAFEPIRVLGERLAHLHHPRNCPLDVELLAHCYGRAMFVWIEDRWDVLPPAVHESGPDAFVADLDTHFKRWLVETAGLLEHSDASTDRWPPRDRAEALGQIRLALVPVLFWAPPEPAIVGIWTGLQARAGDVGLSSEEAIAQLRRDPGCRAAFVHFYSQRGSLASCAFVGRDGHVRIGWRQVRDKVPKDLLREILHAPERGVYVDQEGSALHTLSREPDPVDALEAIHAARLAADLARIIEEVARERAARKRSGSLRWLVLQHAHSLLRGEVGLAELARRTGKSKSGLAEAWHKEKAAILKDPSVRALSG